MYQKTNNKLLILAVLALAVLAGAFGVLHGASRSPAAHADEPQTRGVEVGDVLDVVVFYDVLNWPVTVGNTLLLLTFTDDSVLEVAAEQGPDQGIVLYLIYFEDTYLYMHSYWDVEYYDFQGREVKEINDSSIQAAIRIVDFEYELPETPTKPGHTFIGWYYDEELTIPYEGEPITEPTEFYAKFEIITYTVTFQANGGTVVSGDLVQIVDWSTAAEAPEFEREGYNFLGFDTEFDEVTQDLTVKALWEIKVYTVKFFVNGEVYSEVSVPHGTAFYSASGVQGVMQTLQGLRLMSAGGEITDIDEDTEITGDIEVTGEIRSDLQKWNNFGAWVIDNWILLVVCVVLLAGLVTAIVIQVRRR